MASKLGERLAGYGGEIVHCPNFVPDHGFEEGPRSDALLYVGVLSRGKGVRNLVEAAISNKHVTLDVVGTGLEVGALRTIVSKSNTEDRVRILGRVSQETLLRLYRHARALIVPSIWPENAPLVVLEALANGTPVIGTRWGGLPEILDPIDSRLCKDSDELLENLDDLDWVSALSSVCRREWERLYSPTAFLRRYMNILQEA
jgi:glycosyltransferase involved in cell wall biosynthesis